MMHAHPFGLSTAWNGARHQAAADLLDEHQRLGFRRLEPYCHWTLEQLDELAREARARDMDITSLHGPCPVPSEPNGARGRWGDWLASTYEPDRAYAVDVMKRTVDAAAEVG
ncbi:MAG: sugar phosphate isomerase/epimerase, partial [Chloroflexota bacterium]|nr:sugar phosphate isomerase/epimerase [Chloroflexota bacterium]